eukprot:1235747-Pyramimonas_sp.AAC.2
MRRRRRRAAGVPGEPRGYYDHQGRDERGARMGLFVYCERIKKNWKGRRSGGASRGASIGRG